MSIQNTTSPLPLTSVALDATAVTPGEPSVDAIQAVASEAIKDHSSVAMTDDAVDSSLRWRRCRDGCWALSLATIAWNCIPVTGLTLCCCFLCKSASSAKVVGAAWGVTAAVTTAMGTGGGCAGYHCGFEPPCCPSPC